MWFKQIKLFQLEHSIQLTHVYLCERLEKLAFQDCLPSMPYGSGWIPPVDENDAPLVQTMNGYMMICLQIEEKILPAVVIQQALSKQIKKIESLENRRVRSKEKYALKDEIMSTLLPRAFSKLTKLYAYIDTHNHHLILGTTNTKKTEQFMQALKKTLGENVHPIQVDQLSDIMTSWIKNQNYPTSFSIGKSCVLQDQHHQSRVIRCQDQNLFASSIQSLIQEGCEVKQIALNWQDHLDFVLLDNLSFQGIRFKDETIEQAKEMEPSSKLQQFGADFFIMTQTFSGLLSDILKILADSEDSHTPKKIQSNNSINNDNLIPIAKIH